MLFDAEVLPAIKFALGENVKQSYLPDARPPSLPAIRAWAWSSFSCDSFRAAEDYRRQWEDWEKASQKKTRDWFRRAV